MTVAKKGELREGPTTNVRPGDTVPQGVEPNNVGPRAVLNSKQEKFCHFRALGKTQKDAAALAGYSGHAANASRLENIPAIGARIQELKKKYASEATLRVEIEKQELQALIDNEKLDIAYFVKELRGNLTLARDDRDVKAANDCLKLMMELLGFLGSKGTKDGKNAVDPRTPVKISILNQLANGVGDGGGSAPTHRGALISADPPEALPDLSDDDTELEPDWAALDDEGGSGN